MSERKALTVAIPTCDGARHLAEALRSVLAQSDVEFDLLVVDDRSDDATLALARAEAGDRARIETNSERLGLAGNWNRCVALSGTPWVAVFHQDDVMRPGHLAAHLAAIARVPGMGFVCGATEVIDEDGRRVDPGVVAPGVLGSRDRTYPPGGFVAELVAANPVRCSAVTLRAEAHSTVGGFDPSYRYVVDWDCWLRIARAWSVAWLASPTVAVRWHAASETHRFKSGTDDLDEAHGLLSETYQQLEGQIPDARRLRTQARHNLASAYLNRAYDAARCGDGALARRCVRTAIGMSPRVLGRLARDPRLLARLLLGGATARS